MEPEGSALGPVERVQEGAVPVARERGVREPGAGEPVEPGVRVPEVRARAGQGPAERAGQVPEVRAGQVPEVRAGQVPEVRAGQVPEVRAGPVRAEPVRAERGPAERARVVLEPEVRARGDSAGGS
ncbi:hypothetical protein [Streptomyces syringium]|uniref:hypothetical protein n=1 Tax=Streptomyces syringium TaxID=76729 RepID=UPI0034515277